MLKTVHGEGRSKSIADGMKNSPGPSHHASCSELGGGTKHSEIQSQTLSEAQEWFMHNTAKNSGNDRMQGGANGKARGVLFGKKNRKTCLHSSRPPESPMEGENASPANFSSNFSPGAVEITLSRSSRESSAFLRGSMTCTIARKIANTTREG